MRSAISVMAMLGFTLMIFGCATSQQEPQTLDELLAERGYSLGPGVDRIQRFRVNGWNYVDREHVIVTVGASSQYLVSLRTSCSGLFGAQVIAFTNTVSYLTTFDQLLVKDATRVLERCPIESMNELQKVEQE